MRAPVDFAELSDLLAAFGCGTAIVDHLEAFRHGFTLRKRTSIFEIVTSRSARLTQNAILL